MDNNQNIESNSNIVQPTPPKKKDNKVLIIFLILIILGMGGYITYDKVLKDKIFNKGENKAKEKINKKDNNTTNENKNSDTSEYVKDVNYELVLDGNTNKVSLKYKLEKEEAWGYVVKSDLYINNKKIETEEEIFWGYADSKDDFESIKYENTLAKSKKIIGKDGKEYYVLYYGIAAGGAYGDYLYIIDNQGEVIDFIDECGHYYYESANKDYGDTGFYTIRDNSIIYPYYVEGKPIEKIINIENGKTIVSNGNTIEDLSAAGQC